VLSRRLEAVTYPRLGDDVTRRGRFRLQLLAELADEDPQVFHLFGTLPAPDGSEQGAVRRHFAGMARQIGQQIEFLGSKVDLAAADGDFMGRLIDAEIANLNQRRWFVFSRWNAAEIGADSRQEFLDPERLG